MKAGLEKSQALKGALVEWESEDTRRPVVSITVGKGQFQPPLTLINMESN